VSKNNKVFQRSGRGSEISEHMGIPLRLIPQPVSRYFRLDASLAGIDLYENHEPYFLLMIADEESGRNVNERQWDSGSVESVVVVRTDGKDITPHQVEALVLYCRDVLEQGMEGLEAGSQMFRKKLLEENKGGNSLKSVGSSSRRICVRPSSRSSLRSSRSRRSKKAMTPGLMLPLLTLSECARTKAYYVSGTIARVWGDIH